MAKWSVVPCTSRLVWWWWYLSTTPATCFVNETSDGVALMAFKAAIDQDPFGALSSWNDTVRVHYCEWEGVSCSRRHRHRVIALNLMSQGLVGSLSPHIGNLSFLKSIDLKNNTFHGTIPQEIGRLFRLQNLDFSNNSFAGEIPNNLSHCSNLLYLNLIDNKLIGNIPPGIGSLSKLQSLGLTFNRLSGTIPPSLGNLSSLSKLSLSETALHGEIPEELSRLQSLRFFQFRDNNLSGKIPLGLFNISTIYFFSVYSNQLEGSIPPNIGLTLPNLKLFSIANNQFTGTIPTSLSNASGLEVINFISNNFKGSIPKDLGRLPSLQVIALAFNQLQDDFTFISSLTNCSRLQGIEVSGNLLRGSLPNSIANLSSTHMNFLSMDQNQFIHGIIPAGIGNLLNLNSLWMSMNHLTGPIPASIGKLGKLQEIFLDMNELTEELPSSLGNLTLLNHLILSQNNIYGSIPPTLGSCSNLLELNLSHNNLNGSIPLEIMSLSSISISFSLAHNALTGSLPSQVGSFKNLAVLDMSDNRLSGFIPNSLSGCLSLEWLHMEGNSFEGEIPQGLSALRGLRELDLSHNKLLGRIPSYLGELPGLEKLNLSFNRLHGQVPIHGVFQNASAVSLVGNNGLCGGSALLKLPPCPNLNSKKNKLSHVAKVIIPVAIVSICLALLIFLFIFCHRPKLLRDIKGSLMPSFKSQLFRVSYAELLKATDGFSDANLIGLGSYGSVYKGILEHVVQTVVAVKVLNLQLRGASKSFMAECEALRNIRHRNLLKILTTCSSIDFQGNDFKALVYEFMANGSLEKWLHPDAVDQEEPKNLKLIQRLDIAIDIASALEYLHRGNDLTVVHGDLKPSNVLLDDEMTARVGDFGLAKVISTISSNSAHHHQSNSVAIRGTIGYVAPEYGMGDMVAIQGDVYSYGILLLEMFTGKKPIDDDFKDDLSLHNFVKSALPDQVMEILDPRILLEHEARSTIKNCMVWVLRIGVACSVQSPRDRMEMGEVVSELCKIRDVYKH